MGLDETPAGSFAGAVSRIFKRCLSMFVLAAALLSGGALPTLHDIFAFEAHTHGVGGPLHDVEAAWAGAAEDVTMSAVMSMHQAPAAQSLHTSDDGAPAQHHHPAGGDQDCTHVHVHCCAVPALMVSSAWLPLQMDDGHLRFELNAALPFGQLPYPPMRPPRTTA